MTHTLNVYLLRCDEYDLPEFRGHPSIVRSAKSASPEMAARGAGLYEKTGKTRLRVCIDGDAPQTDPNVATWTLVGVQHPGNNATYTPPAHCDRGHPPLRYLSNGGCVYCAKQKTAAPGSFITVQVPSDVEFDGVVKSMGWTIRARQFKLDRWVLSVGVGDMQKTEGILMARALGWEVVL